MGAVIVVGNVWGRVIAAAEERAGSLHICKKEQEWY
jgi:hypothetical protein